MLTNPGITLGPFGSYQALIGSSTVSGITPVIPTAAPEVNGTAGLSGTSLGAPGSAIVPSPGIASTFNMPLGSTVTAVGAAGPSTIPVTAHGLFGASTAPLPATGPVTAFGVGVPAVGTTAPPTGGVVTPTVFPIPGATPVSPSPSAIAAGPTQAASAAAGGSPVAVAAIGLGPMTSASTPMASTPPATASGPKVFQATLLPVNNSGVHGSATLTLSGRTLTVDLQASGLQPGQIHPQSLVAMAGGGADRLPTAADDTNHDGVIDQSEMVAAVGMPILDLALDPAVVAGASPLADSLAIFPVAGANGTITYHEAFPFNTAPPAANALLSEVAGHLALGAVVLQGMAGPTAALAGYQPHLPVAVGLLHEAATPLIG